MRRYRRIISVGATLQLALGLLITDHSSWADTSTSVEVPQNTSTATTQKPLLERLSEVGTLSLYSVYAGSPINNLGSSYQPSSDGTLDTSSPHVFDTTVTTGYRLSKYSFAGVVNHFKYFPIGNPVGAGDRITFMDPVLYVSRSKLIEYQGLVVDGRLTSQLPLSSNDGLQANGLATALSAVLNAHIDVPTTKLTMGLFGYLRGYIATSTSPANAPTYKVYLAPYANYQLTKRVAATLWIDLLSATRKAGTGLISGLKAGTVDIEPGLNFDITDNISINPVLNLYPGNLTLASTSIMAFLTAKAF
jgi:hypothetical protein